MPEFWAFFGPPTPFILLPSLAKAALQKKRINQIMMGVRIVRIQGKDSEISGRGLLQPVLIEQRHAHVKMGLGHIRLNGDGALEGG